MKRIVAVKFVSQLLTAQRKIGCLEACSALKEKFRNNPNLFSRSPLVMNLGYMDTIHKLSYNQFNEIIQIYVVANILSCEIIKTKLIYFFEVRRVVRLVFVRRIRQLIKIFIWTF